MCSFIRSWPNRINTGLNNTLIGVNSDLPPVSFSRFSNCQTVRLILTFSLWPQLARNCFAAQSKFPGAESGWIYVSEALADNFGFKLSLAAFKVLKKMYLFEPLLKDIHGLNRNQLFFVNTAMLFCIASTDTKVHPTDKHAPPHFRINRGLSNIQEFAESFSCKDTDPMVAKEPCDT